MSAVSCCLPLQLDSFQYRTADLFVKDFELMKNNAIKFNGPANPIALEAVAIHDFVKGRVDANRAVNKM